MGKKRVFTGCLATETNTFSPIPTTLQDYRDCVLYPAGEHPDTGPTMFSAPLWMARQRASELDWELIEGLCAFALPGGLTTRETYSALKGQLLDDLQKALPVDAVLLGLHGAMAAVDCDDCEGDLLSEIRTLCGENTVIAAELDPHCHLTRAMRANADLLIAFKLYPHTDVLARAAELVELTAQTLRGDVRPVTVSDDCEMIAMFYTDMAPVAELVAWMSEAESRDGVLSVSLVHGFASGDVAGMGTRTLVVTDAQTDLAAELSAELKKRVVALRGRTEQARKTVRESVLEVQNARHFPVVIADGADNPGGGAPGDSTHMVRALLDAGIDNIAAGPIWDPVVVGLLSAWGEGAQLDVRIGGKIAPSSGAPLDLRVTVTRIIRNATQDFAGATLPLGDVVAVRSGATDLILCSVRNQCLSRSVFEEAGIELARKRAVVVKSNQHFYDSFKSVAKEVIYLSAPGVNAISPREVSYRKLDRRLWPIA